MTPAGRVSCSCRSSRAEPPAVCAAAVRAAGLTCEDAPVVPEDIHDFFVGSSSVAGALIGLLFVAISVAGPRLTNPKDGAPVHRVRADAALTAFTNALTVSLFALVPGEKLGWTSVAVAIGGLVFVLASLLSLSQVRPRRWTMLRDALFLVGLAVVFVVQLSSGLAIAYHPGDSGSVNTIAILVIVCFILGIQRSWELIGGPSIGLRHEVYALVRGEKPEGGAAEEGGAAGKGGAAEKTQAAGSAKGPGPAEAPDGPPT
jgi:hypothetical protein